MNEAKPWWQQGPKAAFSARIAEMPIQELELLAGEIGGALAVIQGQLEGDSSGDPEWRRRAQQARGFIAERKALVRARIQTLNEDRRGRNEDAKDAAIRDAREKLAAGDIAGAVSIALDILAGAHRQK